MLENGSDAAVVDASKQSRWARMPAELLRNVLMRIEASESTWPARKNVVSCAGVCKNWRETMKRIVKSPEFSGNLTFPISLKQPGSRGSLIQCFVKRNRSKQTYHLYQSSDQGVDEGKFLLAAKRCRHATCTDYIISASLNAEDLSKGSNTYIGKLRGPRRMQCLVNAIPTRDSSSSLPFFGSKSAQIKNSQSGSSSSAQKHAMLPLKNKEPRWHERLERWSLNFNGRVTVASAKNFQLVAPVENGSGGGGWEHENVVLQFGKVGKDAFTMHYGYPISAFQAFVICLSRFDTKITCE
ncbi:hypothetical protein OSB04_023010 [Centaurea solstitialis]|uniref:Tubby C-terminal domain-containing protein n=1 Tax=Centaurea solstitialis TaxID=347529 RepID=A0AA38SQU5_9ASTR|nr:hypothetical protein OSB04_023010 [Centaurea solstitialis]